MSTLKENNLFGAKGVCEKLKASVLSMLEGAKALKKALLHRDVGQINKILAEQQNAYQEVERNSYLWQQLFGDGSNVNEPALAGIQGEIRNSFLELKRLNYCNSSLSRSYLNAIRKVIRDTGMNYARQTTKVYGRRGRMKSKQNSLLINRIG